MYYLIGILLIIGMKYYYSRAGTDELKWILAPTAWWVRMLGGIPFTYESRIGYVNHDLHFIIASSCSGVQFMIITIATLIFSFVHRMRTTKKKAGWLMLSIGGAYISTIMVNGLRILISIWLPPVLNRCLSDRRLPGAAGQIPPETLHTVIGVAVYFTSLLVIYRFAGCFTQETADCSAPLSANNKQYELPGYLAPVFWYTLITLGMPLLNHAYQNDTGNFTGYAGLILLVCTALLLMSRLVTVIQKYLQANS